MELNRKFFYICLSVIILQIAIRKQDLKTFWAEHKKQKQQQVCVYILARSNRTTEFIGTAFSPTELAQWQMD